MDGIINHSSGSRFSVAGYLSGADVFTADITPKKGVSRLSFTFAANAAAILTLMVDNGTTVVDVTLNSGNALVANALFQFDVRVRSGMTYNLKYASNATLLLTQVDEIVQES